MKIIRKSKKRASPPRDSKKEAMFRSLCDTFSQAGVQVRREKLKQGHGWRVASGSCRLEDQSYLFVDRRLSQDEQIAFLLQKAEDLGVPVGTPFGEAS